MADLYLFVALVFTLGVGVLIGLGLAWREVRGKRMGYVNIREIR